MGEETRRADQEISSGGGSLNQQGERWCLIKDINTKTSQVTLVDINTKKLLFGGGWIDIVDAERIVNRYGQLTKGMLVRATYMGVGGQSVHAEITGRPNAKPTEVRKTNNSQPMGWFRIAAPGLGVGV
tara:strand:+ start:12052 stop:12435 length:384 start_codon:yes stop_codon:yes gene_type:complete